MWRDTSTRLFADTFRLAGFFRFASKKLINSFQISDAISLLFLDIDDFYIILRASFQIYFFRFHSARTTELGFGLRAKCMPALFLSLAAIVRLASPLTARCNTGFIARSQRLAAGIKTDFPDAACATMIDMEPDA